MIGKGLEVFEWNDPIAIWRNNGNANDVGGSYDRTVSGPTESIGIRGGAYSFDGNNDTLSYAGDILSSYTAFTLEYILKITGGSDTRYVMFRSSSQNDQIYISTSNEFLVDLYSLSGRINSRSSVLSSDTWYYIAVVYNASLSDSERLKIYVNGSEDTASTSIPQFPGNGSLDTATTENVGHTSNSFQGLIDEIRWDNVAKSSTTIKRIYNNIAHMVG